MGPVVFVVLGGRFRLGHDRLRVRWRDQKLGSGDSTIGQTSSVTQ
jgi:hypothetical protein